MSTTQNCLKCGKPAEYIIKHTDASGSFSAEIECAACGRCVVGVDMGRQIQPVPAVSQWVIDARERLQAIRQETLEPCRHLIALIR